MDTPKITTHSLPADPNAPQAPSIRRRAVRGHRCLELSAVVPDTEEGRKALKRCGELLERAARGRGEG